MKTGADPSSKLGLSYHIIIIFNIKTMGDASLTQIAIICYNIIGSLLFRLKKVRGLKRIEIR